MAKSIPKTHLLTEDEWRSIGVQQSKGWVHYMIHEPGKLSPSRFTIIQKANFFFLVLQNILDKYDNIQKLF